MPKSISSRHNRYHFFTIPLKYSGDNKVFIDQCGDGLAEVHIIKRGFPDIESHVVKGASFVGEQTNIGRVFKIIHVSRLNSPPEHVDTPFFNRKDGSIGGSEKLENNSV